MRKHDLHKKSAGDEVKSSRHVSQGGTPVAVPNITDAELVEAREQADAGLRLAFPQLAERASSPEVAERQPLNPETAERVADDLATGRGELMAALKRLDLDREQDGAADLHLRIGAVVNELDDISALLAERHSS